MDDKQKTREKHKKVLADYQALVEGWPLKETIEERMQAFKEAQEMEPRARVAELCLGLEKTPTEEQRIQRMEAFCEWIGVDSSQIWKWIARKNKNRN
jgi:hypothetical protein